MLPKDWNDITIEQYVAVYKTLKDNPKDTDSQSSLLILLTCLLTDKEPEWVEDNLTLNDLAKMQDFLKLDLPKKLVRDFRFNGKRYKVDIDPTKYNAGRYISVMNQLKGDNDIDSLHKVVYQVCREVNWMGFTKKKNISDIPTEIESFKQLPLKIANPIAVFFCNLSESLMLDIQKYLTNQMKKITADLQAEIDSLADTNG
jgi:hypothetical protein